MPVASLLAQQLGGLRVKRTQGARALTPAPTPSAPVVEVAPVAPAPAHVATRDVLLAAHRGH
jgi:hypothetical protein